jgi:hypothetical protein
MEVCWAGLGHLEQAGPGSLVGRLLRIPSWSFPTGSCWTLVPASHLTLDSGDENEF